jgi:mannose-1-phosphate guanylyltransferase
MIKKDRITITLDKQILQKIDKLVKKDSFRNRSHAIEDLIEKSLTPKISQAVILAAGKGVRWRPLTYEIPKALIPIKGKPVLEHILDSLKEYDIKNVCLVIGSLGDQIKEYFGNGKRLGIKIKYIHDKQEKGTAPALKMTQKYLSEKPFFVWYVDELADIDLNHLREFHFNNKALGTVALSSIADPTSMGTVKLQGSRVTDFFEKPHHKKIESHIVNAGIFIFEPAIFSYFQKKDLSLETQIFPRLIKDNKLYGCLFSGQWYDLGTPDAYAKALKKWEN